MHYPLAVYGIFVHKLVVVISLCIFQISNGFKFVKNPAVASSAGIYPVFLKKYPS